MSTLSLDRFYVSRPVRTCRLQWWIPSAVMTVLGDLR